MSEREDIIKAVEAAGVARYTGDGFLSNLARQGYAVVPVGPDHPDHPWKQAMREGRVEDAKRLRDEAYRAMRS